jgi:hypothetical protein
MAAADLVKVAEPVTQSGAQARLHRCTAQPVGVDVAVIGGGFTGQTAARPSRRPRDGCICKRSIHIPKSSITSTLEALLWP